MKLCSLVVSAVALVAPVAHAALSPLGEYNLIVLGSVQSSSEVEGRAWIGGNLTGSASNYGVKLNGIQPSVVTLAVGGNINVNNVNVNHGSMTYGGTVSGNINMNQANAGATKTGGVALDVAGMTAALTSTSNYFKSLAANSTVSIPSGQPGPLNFTVASGVTDAVFSVSAADVFGNNLAQQINLNNAAGVNSIVINVTGTSVSFSGGTNFSSAFNDPNLRSKIIWNFHQATSITIDRNFFGALLAPSAALTNSTPIEGSVGVASFTQNGEVHLPLSIVQTPEPASLAVLGMMPLLRRRRIA